MCIQHAYSCTCVTFYLPTIILIFLPFFHPSSTTRLYICGSPSSSYSLSLSLLYALASLKHFYAITLPLLRKPVGNRRIFFIFVFLLLFLFFFFFLVWMDLERSEICQGDEMGRYRFRKGGTLPRTLTGRCILSIIIREKPPGSIQGTGENFMDKKKLILI